MAVEALTPRFPPDSALAQTNPLVFADCDRERRRIETALHDGLQQDLSATAVGLQLVVRALDAEDPEAARKLLDELIADIETALERLRALAHTIYPSSLPAWGLAGALAGRAAAGPLDRYPLEVEEAVYFACHELLTETTEARVWEEDGTIRLEISGAADPAAVAHARARLVAVGGQLTVSCGGAAVTGAVPVPSPR
jgi:hypothetical protein